MTLSTTTEDTLARARRLLGEGSFAEAHDLLRNALLPTRPDAALLRMLAEAALALKAPDSAEGWWRRAIKAAPEAVEGHMGLGRLLYLQNRLGGAVESYRRALSLAPDHPGVRLSLAIALQAADCPALARDMADTALADDSLADHPGSAEMRLVRARALVDLGQIDAAVEDLAWLHTSGHKLAEVGLLECEVNRQRGDHELALMLAAELCEAYPESAAPLLAFREIFADFFETAPSGRLAEFLDGLALPLPGCRLPDPPARGRAAPVDVIIPVHDGLEHLTDCLAALEAARCPLLGRIILVDDCSSPQTARWLAEQASARRGIQVLRTPRQQGFTGALLIGLTASSASRFVALNSDTRPGPGWLEALSAAMPEGSGVAMVGPLSNNAAWQGTAEIFDASGNYAVQQMPDPDQQQRLAAHLRFLSVMGAADTPLIQGFCVLVERAIYDDLGGLDAGLFPQGYGEFQDLSLRALDAGHGLRIATDCFVAHARGGSIGADRRASLSRAARRALYDRHTALRYLAAECSACLNPQLVFTRRRLAQVARHSDSLLDRVDTAAKVVTLGPLVPRFTGQKVCLFVSYAPDGTLLPCTRDILAALRRGGYRTVLIMAVEGDHPPPSGVEELADLVLMRANQGLDFGAWTAALTLYPELWQAGTLLFANDSVLGPLAGFDRVLGRIDASPADLVYLTDSDDSEPHFQSFFWALKNRGPANPVLRHFLTSVRDMSHKTACIVLYELFLRHVAERLAGLRAEGLFPMSVLSGVDSQIRPTFNPTHHLWRELLAAGFPFLKADFCRRNASGPDADLWLQAVELHGGDPLRFRRHVEASRLQRARA
ncbi:glycosyltransferase [Oceanicola sp. S124]|uniref:glycosyltransferase n=1 Tax=Oceanicola sp. S124 TaxID=1042378 RepID=UPI0002557DEC|nr:glycosyltransferase [Oceanicola sp. S124]